MTGTSAAVQVTCQTSAYRPYRPAGRNAKYGRFSVLPRPEIYRNLRIKDSVKIDPPYNTGSEKFVYTDDFTLGKQEFEEVLGLFDENGYKLFYENNCSNPRFHSVWCSMIYSRLLLSRNILADDGVIFISI